MTQPRNDWILNLLLSLLVIFLIGSFAHAQDTAPTPTPGMAAPASSAAPAPSAPSPAPKIDKGDNAWMLTSSALVLMMTIPGLFLFYGGLVRSKNILGTIMHSFIMVGVVTVQWVLWGYSVAFGPDIGGLFGSLAWFGLNGVGVEPNADYAATIPHMTFMVYQMMFAIITPALITGAFAERAKFSTFLVFMILWTTIVYDPLAHWVWGVKGWMREMGALDFAGGTVVHISSGSIGLGRGNHVRPPDWLRPGGDATT